MRIWSNRCQFFCSSQCWSKLQLNSLEDSNHLLVTWHYFSWINFSKRSLSKLVKCHSCHLSFGIVMMAIDFLWLNRFYLCKPSLFTPSSLLLISFLVYWFSSRLLLLSSSFIFHIPHEYTKVPSLFIWLIHFVSRLRVLLQIVRRTDLFSL